MESPASGECQSEMRSWSGWKAMKIDEERGRQIETLDLIESLLHRFKTSKALKTSCDCSFSLRIDHSAFLRHPVIQEQHQSEL